MAYSFKCQQFDSAYLPHRLSNWETPVHRVKTPTTRPPGYKTECIVDDNGHLLKGVARRNTSFHTGFEASAHGTRWPVSALAPFGGVATMGFKGIQTHYLPTSTVYTRNNPDSDEFNVRSLR